MTPPAASQAHAAPPLAPRRRRAGGATTAPRPRRVSGPARAPARPAQPVRAGERSLALGLLGLLARLDALASHRMLDRLIRSRVWIGIVAFALLGIVTLQLGLLKLNSGIGRALEREASLQRENAALSVENSELAAGSRVEAQAAALGLQLVSVAGLKFLGSHPGADIGKAAATLRAAPAREAAPQAEATGAATAPEAGSAGASEATTGQTAASGEAAESGSGEAGGEAAPGAAAERPEPTASEHTSSSSGGGEAQAGGESSSAATTTSEGGGAAAPTG